MAGRAVAVVCAALFYATGNFGLLNVLGARRPTQVVLVLALIPFGAALLARPWWLRSPAWWLVAVAVVAEVLVRNNASVFYLLDLVIAAVVVGILVSADDVFRRDVLSAIVFVCAVLSSMVVVQAIIVWFNPQVLRSFVLGYTTSTAGSSLTIGHPLEYLGFTTPGTLWVFGHPFTRFRSFTSEPSVVICGFYAPGVLALACPKPLRYAAVPILAFAVVLSGAGTAFLSVGLGIVAWILLRPCSLFPRAAAAVPLVLIMAWWVFLTQVDIKAMLTAFANLLAPIESSYTALNKVVAGHARLSVTASLASDVRSYWLYGAETGGGGGFLLNFFVTAGVAGLAAALAVSYRILLLAVNVFRAAQGRERLFAGLVYGLWIQVMGFTEFGWITLSGFMMIALMICRLERMHRQHVPPVSRPLVNSSVQGPIAV